MGALPKNKITRVEQGKRRRGNAPKLKRDANSAIPNHKQGFVAELMRFVGIDKNTTKTASQPDTKVEVTSAVKTAKAKSQAGTKATQATSKMGMGTKVAAPKVRKTVAQSGK